MTTTIDKIPSAVSYIPRILIALRRMDGVAKAAAVKDAVVASMGEAGLRIDETQLQSGAIKYTNDMQWARMYLVDAGMLDPASKAGHGIWKLTDQGWQTKLDEQSALAIYNVSAQKHKKKIAETAAAPDDDGEPELVQSWETQLVEILTNLPDKGFERLCAQLMTKNGLHATAVTGKSGDGGIDGEGWMALDSLGLISVRVAWQCKRYKDGPIGSPKVRDFRGALNNTTNHGIIFATTTFTADAQQEAAMPGKKLIRLVDLKTLIPMLVQFHFGVWQNEKNKGVDIAFFEPYQNPAEENAPLQLSIK